MKKIERRPDWPECLAETVRAARGRPFQWGRHDCALFACDCIAAMTGVDPAARFRGRYKTARGAVGALKRYGSSAEGFGPQAGGVRSLEELATRVLGVPIRPEMARRGDIVSFDTALGPVLGVSLGSRAAFTGPEGLTFVPVSATRQAWRVG